MLKPFRDGAIIVDTMRITNPPLIGQRMTVAIYDMESYPVDVLSEAGSQWHPDQCLS